MGMSEPAEALSAWILGWACGGQLCPPTRNAYRGLLCEKNIILLIFFNRPTNSTCLSSVAAVNIILGYSLIHQSVQFQWGNQWALTVCTQKS